MTTNVKMTLPEESPTVRRVNVPNLMSGLRLALGPTAGVLFVGPSFLTLGFCLCSIGVFLDVVDGWYARRFSQTTPLGAFIDPLADKVMMGVVYGIIAAGMGSVAVWGLFATIVGRDIAVTVSRLRRYRSSGRAYPANGLAKIKTAVQSIAGLAILFVGVFVRPSFSFSPEPVVAVLIVVAALSYASAARYRADDALRVIRN